MTLPFRRRHNDAEATHDRARAMASDRLIAPLSDDDEAWLVGHLDGCGDCRQAVEAFEADRMLLRTLRDDSPEPPRDLWARTSAAIEREAGHGSARRAVPRRLRLSTAQLGTLSSALVILVVVGASVFSGNEIPNVSPTGTPRESGSPEPTPISVAAGGLNWLAPQDDGTYELTVARVDHVCPTADRGCAPLEQDVLTTITLAEEPQAVVISPTSEQLVIVTSETSGSSVLVLPVSTPEPSGGPSPTPEGSAATSTEPSNRPSVEPSNLPSVEPSNEPSLGPSGSPGPTPEPTPEGATAIATGVTVVGEPSYSGDGAWFAFAARPSDGPGGPDLYVWHVGDPQATQVTFDGRSIFTGWAGAYVLGSHVAEEIAPVADESPAPSDGASAEPTVSPTTTPTPDPSAPVPSPTPDVAPHLAQTFLLDPVTGTATLLLAPSVWRPAVDSLGTRVVYWDGTVEGDGAGGWTLGTGRLVLDAWTAPEPPVRSDASFDPNATPGPSSEPTPTPELTFAPSIDPSASPQPTPAPPGPAGTPQVLFETDAPIVDFDARFDPTGTRLAVWVADANDPKLGRLQLFVIDPATGLLDSTVEPLPGVPALRGFSIEHNRLAWVTPPGQDGDDSRISVLAWRGNVFGRLESNPGMRIQIVH